HKGNDSVKRLLLYKQSQKFLANGDINQFDRSIESLIQESQQSVDSLMLGRAFNLKASKFYSVRNDSAFFYLIKAEKIFQLKKDSLFIGLNYIDRAFVHLAESDYANCEIAASKALGFIKSNSNPQRMYDAYNLIGICSNELRN